ncbi:aromatic acid exporter family protein [Shouchella shacheensis]|uniref:aromatic acid exporter family protein n=1 Tax=Shouchella shacheensis TaxID=1649580 RepID=UPI0009E93EC0|nr:aromatic acid exporter family protein [Shouchella shacheensis]
MPFKIGYRTLKTAVGATIAIAVAEWMGLEFASSAAIIAILCISVTRKNSMRVSWARFVACMVGLVLSAIIFEIFGYHPLSLGLFILCFIPAVLPLGAKEGIVTSSVIVLHLYVVGGVSVHFFLNELQLILIGIGTALLMNLYMPSVERDLRQYRKDIEEKMQVILRELSVFIRNGESDWSGEEIPELDDQLKRGKALALRSLNNHLLREEDHYYHYFHMREKQLEIIERLMPYLARMSKAVTQSKSVADFLEELSTAVSPTNSVPYFLLRLEEMREEFRQMPLPTTRTEFEVRSSLYYMMHEFEQYLHVKERLWANKKDKTRQTSES